MCFHREQAPSRRYTELLPAAGHKDQLPLRTTSYEPDHLLRAWYAATRRGSSRSEPLPGRAPDCSWRQATSSLLPRGPSSLEGRHSRLLSLADSQRCDSGKGKPSPEVHQTAAITDPKAGKRESQTSETEACLFQPGTQHVAVPREVNPFRKALRTALGDRLQVACYREDPTGQNSNLLLSTGYSAPLRSQGRRTSSGRRSGLLSAASYK